MPKPYRTPSKRLIFRNSGGRFRRTVLEDIGMDSRALAQGGETCGMCGARMMNIIARPVCNACTGELAAQGRRYPYLGSTSLMWKAPVTDSVAVILGVDGVRQKWWATGPAGDPESIRHAEMVHRAISNLAAEAVRDRPELDGRVRVETASMRFPDGSYRIIAAYPGDDILVLTNDSEANLRLVLDRCRDELERLPDSGPGADAGTDPGP